MSTQLPTSPISGNVLFNKSAMLDADYRTDTFINSERFQHWENYGNEQSK